jgi:hypothetical protein
MKIFSKSYVFFLITSIPPSILIVFQVVIKLCSFGTNEGNIKRYSLILKLLDSLINDNITHLQTYSLLLLKHLWF